MKWHRVERSSLAWGPMSHPQMKWHSIRTFWRQSLRNSDSISVKLSFLNYFVSQSSAVRCNSVITAYVISLNISTQNPDTLHFHVLSQVVSGTNRLFVRAIARLQNKTRKVSSGVVWRNTQRSFKHFPQWHFSSEKSVLSMCRSSPFLFLSNTGAKLF